MAGKLIGKVAMTAAERQRRWRVRVRKTKAVERIAAKASRQAAAPGRA